jgi:hypothetical protein
MSTLRARPALPVERFRPNGPPLLAPRAAAGRRGSSEDDLPLRLNHAQDRGVGRGLNPAPDERRPAVFEYDEWSGTETTIARKLRGRELLQLL